MTGHLRLVAAGREPHPPAPLACCACRLWARRRASSRPRSSRGRWPRCSGGGIPLVNAIGVAGRAIGNRFMAAELDVSRPACARGRVDGRRDGRAGPVPGRGREDGRSGRVHRGPAGHAQQPRGLLRRGDRDDAGALRDAHRADAARASWGSSSRCCCSHSTCRCSSCRRRLDKGYRHVATPVNGLGAPNGRRTGGQPGAGPLHGERAPVRGRPRARDRQRAPAGGALSSRVRRHGGLPPRPGPVPVDSGGPHAPVRLRAAPAGRQRPRHRRVGSRPTCR